MSTSIETLDHLAPLPHDKSVPIGCIGAGFIMADCHLVAYREQGLNPVAITSRDAGKAHGVADQHGIPTVHESVEDLLADEQISVLDIAVPPDVQPEIIRKAVRHRHLKGILAQKPLATNYYEARELVRLCQDAGITLAVNQNMRFDHSVRACKTLLNRGELGMPVLATIDMRAIPHWMPWQERLGWVTCRIMSIHHLDTMRYWFGDPNRVFASFLPDPRTSAKFAHEDGIGLYILEYDHGLRCMICDDVWAGPAREGAASDLGVIWRVEGTEGLAKGTIGWPDYPQRAPSTIDYSTISDGEPAWHSPRWDEVWFPDAFVGPMADLLCALEQDRDPMLSGEDNLMTMALVDAAYQSAAEKRAVELDEITSV